MGKIIDLVWQGPYAIKDILSSSEHRAKFGCTGVYLWEEPTPNGLSVTYVGKANNLWYRQLEHYWFQLGSAYLLPGKYRECGNDWSLDLSRPEVLEILFDLANFQKLVAENFKYIHNLNIHLAPCEDNTVIERNLIFQLKPIGNERGKKTKPLNEVSFVHQNARWTSNRGSERISE